MFVLEFSNHLSFWRKRERYRCKRWHHSLFR